MAKTPLIEPKNERELMIQMAMQMDHMGGNSESMKADIAKIMETLSKLQTLNTIKVTAENTKEIESMKQELRSIKPEIDMLKNAKTKLAFFGLTVLLGSLGASKLVEFLSK